MTADDWDPAGKATWTHVHREPGKWMTVRCICQCRGPDKWVLQVGSDDWVELPSWQEVLDVTPMLIGIYKARNQND
jgi:hypothetical protein